MKLNFTKTFNILLATALVMFSLSANAQLSKSKNGNDGAKMLLSGTITANNYYIPGSTATLVLELNLATPDEEYGDSLAITFPAGFTVNSASNPFPSPLSGNQPAEALRISSGTMAVWGDNDNSFGGIEPGIHLFIINVTAASTLSGPQTVNFYLSGDEFGTAPNFFAGSFVLNELPSSPDLIVEADPIGYTMIPLNQLKPNYAITGTVFNNGAQLTSNQNAIAASLQASYNSTVALTNPFNTYSSQTLTFSPISFQAKNTYNIIVGVPLGGDFDLSNNADTLQVIVTDTVMARDNGIADGSLGITNSSQVPVPGTLGNMFEFVNTGYLSSVSFYLDGATIGDSLQVVIYNYNTAPTNQIAQSNVTSVTTTQGWMTVNLDQTATLVPGKYFIGIKQVKGFLGLGYTEENFVSNVSYYNTVSSPTFINLETAGLPVLFMVRPNIGSTAPLSAPSLVLPADNAVNVAITNVVLDWSDVTGASSYEYQYSTSSTFSAGTTTSATTALSTATISNLSLNTTYYWRARAVSSTAGAWSNTRTFTTIEFGVGIDATAKNLVNIYPNPASDLINLTNLKNANVEIYNILGAKVRSVNNLTGNVTINVADLANGSYIVTVKSEDFTTTKKITVNN